jgi:CBS domain containing-hemolysin-like protein
VDRLIILGLILLDGVFSMSELAVVSSKRMRLEKLSQNGAKARAPRFSSPTVQAAFSQQYRLVLPLSAFLTAPMAKLPL